MPKIEVEDRTEAPTIEELRDTLGNKILDDARSPELAIGTVACVVLVQKDGTRSLVSYAAEYGDQVGTNRMVELKVGLTEYLKPGEELELCFQDITPPEED